MKRALVENEIPISSKVIPYNYFRCSINYYIVWPETFKHEVTYIPSHYRCKYCVRMPDTALIFNTSKHLLGGWIGGWTDGRMDGWLRQLEAS